MREWRTRARLRKTLVDERTTWLQRVQTTLLHHGVRGAPERLRSAAGADFLARLELPAADLERIDVALAMADALDRQLAPIESELRRLARARGASRWQVRSTMLDESLMITIAGSLVGVAAGTVISRAWLRGLDEVVPGMSFHFPGPVALTVALAAVVLGVIAAIPPSAARRPPQGDRGSHLRIASRPITLRAREMGEAERRACGRTRLGVARYEEVRHQPDSHATLRPLRAGSAN